MIFSKVNLDWPKSALKSNYHFGGMTEQKRALLPTNSLVSPILTDLYQITMVYAYWKEKRQNDFAVFDLFFRKNPFKGEYTVFAGLEEALALIQNFKFTISDIEYLRGLFPRMENEFFDWLATLDCSGIRVFAVKEGTIVFPRVPVIRVEGHLGVGQLLETPLLNLLNYASLVTTNATRFLRAAGPHVELIEFGLRRAQGPDGGLSASRYAYMAGFAGTSNVLAGKLHNIPVKGTNAHAFIQAHLSLDQVKTAAIDGKNITEIALKYRRELEYQRTNNGELAAFISYAAAFPDAFLALVDTYDTMASGIPNFICVALALHELGHQAIGIRLDSGDLSYLSRWTRAEFIAIGERYKVSYFKNLNITASNDINEAVLNSLNEQGHAINTYGIGTHLVTCQAQPALGMVYKLVEINGSSRIKLSEDIAKVTIPGAKSAFRLLGENGKPILDVMIGSKEPPPTVGKRILCRHPFDELRRAYVTPSKTISLHELVWDGSNGGLIADLPTLEQRREYVWQQFQLIREDVVRSLNATPYKVSVSNELYDFIHDMWLHEYPVHDLH
uniref:Nicotinate phosphoribosyltransferase n=1 Tax=Albugo laibachii Nc14 TaxID=890382 RepID=F0WPV2_9STRA|nr:nicotinate phosphoribosyltransferase putative [Albugo laibachii Nc14]|eukprot:CCA23353.1 nicotinate phosphoribosyltransferase putative [Albugo laibachii Nc14]